MACGRGCLWRFSPRACCWPWRIRGGDSEVICRRSLSACSLARFTEPPPRLMSLGFCMGKSIATNAGVMVYSSVLCRSPLHLRSRCNSEIGVRAILFRIGLAYAYVLCQKVYRMCEECQHPQGCTARLWDSGRLAQNRTSIFSEEGRTGIFSEVRVEEVNLL